MTQLVQSGGPQPKHTSGVVQMLHETTHWVDKDALWCSMFLMELVQHGSLQLSLTPSQEDIPARASASSWLIYTNRSNLEGSNPHLEVLHRVPALLLSQRCHHQHHFLPRWAIIIHWLPVCGANVDHCGLRQKDANEDVMWAVASAAISQFISILSL